MYLCVCVCVYFVCVCVYVLCVCMCVCMYVCFVCVCVLCVMCAYVWSIKDTGDRSFCSQAVQQPIYLAEKKMGHSTANNRDH